VSPRRRFRSGDAPLFVAKSVAPPGRYRPPLFFTLVALMVAGALTVCTLTLIAHESQRRALLRDVSVLDGVRAFMTMFASPDPFHANDYVDRVLANATGEFAKQYQEKANHALLQVARSEPTTGTVLDVGIERWNDDGTANVLVITDVTSKTPDGKNVVDVKYRWLVTAEQEGAQWKISSLLQVI
jgi:Mce-associated membrane protein